MNKRIEKLITERIKPEGAPYYFRIKGVSGPNNSAYGSAVSTYEHVKAWAEKQGAEVEIIKNYFPDVKRQKDGYLLIEVTDPAAWQIEQKIGLIKQIG